MKKRILAFLLTTVMAISLFPQISFAATVASGTCGENLTWTLDDEGVLTISGTGEMTDYEMGSSPWYTYNSDVKTAILSDGVTSIGDGAFSYCGSLLNVTIPGSVKTIGYSAFYNCTKLASVEIPDSVTTIGEYAFDRNWALESITIPDSVTYLGDGAFSDCIHLKSAVIGNGVTSLYSTFYGCSDLENVTIPYSVTFIDDGVFSSCESLTDVYYTDSENRWNNIYKYGNNFTNVTIHYNKSATLPDTAYIGYCGTDNNNVTWLLDTETGVLTISGNGAMADDENSWDNYMDYVKSVVIEEGVTSIGTYAFYWSGLTDITIADSVTSIGESAFSWCENLASITIPAGVTYISEYAFSNCKALASIDVDSQNSTYCSIDGVLYSKDKTNLLVYPRGKTAEEIIIPEGVQAIGDSLFANCYNVKKIVIPESVASIGYAAFQYCEALESITIPARVASIESSAFEGCKALTSINVDSQNSIYCSIDGVLYSKDATTLLIYPKGKTTETFTIPTGVTSISDGAFSGCNNLKKVIIPNGVTAITSNMFSNCDSLESVEIPDSVTSIGNSAFDYCWNLQSIKIPNSVTSIDSYAFQGSSNLSDITIPDSVTSIGEYAFAYTAYYNDSENWENNVLYINNHLIEAKNYSGDYEIKEGTKTIAAYAFAWCSNLSSVKIPEGVTAIDEYTFYDCGALASVTIPKSVTAISGGAFNYNYSLTDVYYAGSMDDWDAITIDSGNDPLINATIHSADEANLVSSGTCGDNLTWILDNEGTLTIKGTGSMYHYTGWEGAPWVEYLQDIKKIVIKDGVTSIGEYAFYCCTSLTDVTIANTVETIGGSAFSYCPKLPEITIPAGVTFMGNYVFSDNYALAAINVDESNAYYSSQDGVLFDKNKTTLILFPVRKSGRYEIPNTVTTIKSNAFNLSSSERSSAGGTTAGGGTAASFVGLTALTIPYSVTTIEEYAFYGCSDLESITVDEGNQSYSSAGGVLFDKDKTNLIYFPGGKSGSYTVPNTVKTIPANAFVGSKKLTNVTLQSGVTSIGNSAFAECPNLVSVSMPNSLETIGMYAFAGCNSLSGVIIPESITEIKQGTFNMCSSLQGIVIPSSVTNIGDYAFNDCTELENVYYAGSEDSWRSITIGSYYNDNLTAADRHYGNAVAIPSLYVSAKGEAAITVANATGEETVFVAVYDLQGKLSDTKQVTLSDGVGITNLSSDAKTAKAFVWNLSDIKPLSAPAIRDIQ